MVKMKVRHAAALALAICLTGCAAQADHSAAQIELAARAECGDHLARQPLSDRCIELLRETGAPELILSMARETSDLTTAMWRACPSKDPCAQLPECQLYSRASESGSKAAQDIARTSCENAQEADYSCRSLQSDPAYQTQSRAWKACVESRPPGCAGLALGSPVYQPDPKLSLSANRAAFEQSDEAFRKKTRLFNWGNDLMDNCHCLSLMGDDNSAECRQAVSGYNQDAERWTAMSTSNNPPSPPATAEPSSALATTGAALLKALPAAAAAGLAAGSGGPYPEAPPPTPPPRPQMPAFTQCYTWGNQTNCTSQ
jgi:hypothetical protein